MDRREFLSTGLMAAACGVVHPLSAAEKEDKSPFSGFIFCRWWRVPIKGVVVSDGLNCVKTDDKGHWELPYREEAAFITVTPPSGYMCNWISTRTCDRKEFEIYLTAWKAGAGKGCTFVQITDSEIKKADANEREWVDRVIRIAAENDCAFIVHTGDICSYKGLIAHNQLLNNATAERPVYYAAGNHDMDFKGHWEHFESTFGSHWFSFEAGGIHFVVTPFHPYADKKKITAWLKNDLKMIDPKMPVIFFGHWIPHADDDRRRGHFFGDLDLNTVCNYCGFVYGHAHASIFRREGKATYVNTTPPQCGGINNEPSQIRVLKADAAGRLTCRTCYGHIDEKDWGVCRGGAAWEAKLPGRVHFGAPLVAKGTVYAGTGDEDGLGEAYVCALDAGTGRFRWKTQVGNSIKNRLALVAGTLVAADSEARIYGFDPKTGREKWRQDLGLNNSAAHNSGCIPAGDGKTVVTGVGKRLVRIDAASGRILWRNSEWNRCTDASPMCSAVGEGVVLTYVNWSDVFCNDLGSGKLLWTSKLQGCSSFAGLDPFIRDGKAYVLAAASIVVFDLKTGRQLQIVNAPANVMVPGGCPARAADRFYIGSASPSLFAIDFATLKAAWRSDKFGAAKLVLPAYSRAPGSHANTVPRFLGKDRLAAAASDGTVRVFDRATGRELKKFETGAPYLAPVAVDGNAVYAADFAGFLRRFDV